MMITWLRSRNGQIRALVGIGLLVLLALLWPLIQYSVLMRDAMHAFAAGDVARAHADYRQAVERNPSSILAYRGLARTAFAEGDSLTAITALEMAWRLRPDSVLVRQELAEMYAKTGQIAKADALWAEMGITAERMLAIGDSYFQVADYLHAAEWYSLSVGKLNTSSVSVAFRLALTSILANQPLPERPDPQVLPIHELDASLQIEAETLQWVQADPEWGLDYGAPLSQFPQYGDLTVGVLWWDAVAVTVIDVQHEGVYQVAVRARNGARSSTVHFPALLHLEHNFVPVLEFTVEANDETWYTFETDLALSPGFHVIGVRCLRIEPDPVLDWILVQRKP